jgi:hypothetical protein
MLQRFVDAAAVEAEIAHVRSLSGNALRRPQPCGGNYPVQGRLELCR